MGWGLPVCPGPPSEETSQSQPSRSRRALEGRRQGPDLRRRLAQPAYKGGSAEEAEAAAAAAPRPARPPHGSRAVEASQPASQDPAGGMARPELPLLRKPRGLFSLLALLAFALLLEGRCGRAAPLPGTEEAPPLAKIYPRGSHWAVGESAGGRAGCVRVRVCVCMRSSRQERAWGVPPPPNEDLCLEELPGDASAGPRARGTRNAPRWARAGTAGEEQTATPG